MFCFIFLLQMLKPLLRRLSKRSRVPAKAAPQEEYCSDFSAENAANEALEARLQQGTTTHGTMAILVTPEWYHAAPDRDILCDSFSSCSQTPEQQSPSPKSVQLHEQEWW